MTVRLATDMGLAAVVNALVAANTPFLGWGGGSGQGESSTDVAIPFTEARVVGAPVATTTTVTAGDTYQVNGVITADDAHAVTEVGVFGSIAGVDMQFYGDFPAINVSAGDSIAFIIDVVVDQA